MKSTIITLSGLVLIMMAIASCSKDSGLPNKKSGGIDSTRLVDVRYGRDIKPILTTYCLGKDGQGCHVENSNTFALGNFENYDELKDKVDNGTIQSRVFEPNGGMPPSYSLSPTTLDETDLAVFKKWVADGAPNN